MICNCRRQDAERITHPLRLAAHLDRPARAHSLLRLLMLVATLLCFSSSWAASTVPAGQTAAAPILNLANSEERVALGRWLDILAYDGQILTPSDLISDNSQFHWQRYGNDSLSLGLVSHPVWLRLQIENPGADTERILELNRATLSHIGLYSQRADGFWQWREAGVQALSPRGDMQTVGFGFRLLLPHGQSTHIIRLESSYALTTNIVLSNYNAALHFAQESAGWYGWGLGLMTGLMIAALASRPRKYPWQTTLSFVLLQLAIILFMLSDRGVLGNWWLTLPGAQHGILQVSTMLLQLALIWFTVSLLQAKRALTALWHRLLITLLGIEAAALMVGLALEEHIGVLVLGIFPITTGLVITLACFSGWRRGAVGIVPPLLCFAALFAVCAVINLTLFGQMPLLLEPYQLIMLWQLFSAHFLFRALQESQRQLTDDTTSAPLANSQRTLSNASSSRTKHSGNHPLRAHRVLVVEDNIWVQQVIMGLLNKLGCEVLVASNGQEALQIMANERIDLVLMDCDLPGLDGVSVTQIWRQREANLKQSPLPIVAITAHVSEEQRQIALQAGMNEFLAKPVDLRKLRDTLLRWVPHAAQTSAAQASASAPRDGT